MAWFISIIIKKFKNDLLEVANICSLFYSRLRIRSIFIRVQFSLASPSFSLSFEKQFLRVQADKN